VATELADGGPASFRLSRRCFLGCLASAAAGATLAPLPAWAKTVLPRALPEGAEAPFYQRLADGRVACQACPWGCELGPGETSRCRAKANRDGKLVELDYGLPCVINLDPIEKGPLFHFHPGETSLALGGAGCNLACQYCQNWQVSQKGAWETKNIDMPVARCSSAAKEKKCRAVTFTYTEPAVELRYATDVFAAARRHGLYTHAVSAVFLHAKPMRLLCEKADAFSAALKGFDEAFYRDVVGGELAPVLTALTTIRESGAWLEIVTLVVPGMNDQPATIGKMAKWIVQNLGADTPLHLTRFVPEYRLQKLPRTSIETLEAGWKAARDAGLRFVYLGNVPGHNAENTFCPSCQTRLVARLGFKLLENRVQNGKCPTCGAAIPGKW
jgi:pyruvate formate lyase activating enzyme